MGYFVKISKEGKRHDNVRKSYEEKCPLTASESEELLNSNHIKYKCVWIMMTSMSFFNYFSHVLQSEYGEELSVREFREVMKDVLKAGGIMEVHNEVNNEWRE